MTNIQLILRGFFVSVFLQYLSSSGKKPCVSWSTFEIWLPWSTRVQINSNHSIIRLWLLYMCSQGSVRAQLVLTQNNYHTLDSSLLLHSSDKMGKMHLEPEPSSLHFSKDSCPEKMSSALWFSWAQHWAETICCWRSHGFSTQKFQAPQPVVIGFLEPKQESFEFYSCKNSIVYLENCRFIPSMQNFTNILNDVIWVPHSLTN